MSHRNLRSALGSAVVAAVLLAGCASTSDSADPAPADPSPDETTDESPDETTDRTTADDEAQDLADIDLDELPDVVIEDLEIYWDETMPAVYDVDYEPLSGGTFAYDEDNEPPSCGGQPGDYEGPFGQGNAFYCPPDDLVAWDAGFLVPMLDEDYGPYAVAMVLAHEWGHAVQARSGIDAPSIVTELQADCFAGSWTAWVYEGDSERITIDDSAFGEALGGLVFIRDEPGTPVDDPLAHGTAFDRINAYQEGFEQGASRCAEYEDDLPPPLELEFTDEVDFENGGNLPLADIVDLTTNDLNLWWAQLLDGFEPLDGVVAFEVGDADVPSCDGDLDDEDAQEEAVIYCIDDNVVAADADYLADVHEEVGDAGVAALLSQQWALGALIQAGEIPEDPFERLLAGVCFTGAWTADIYQRDPDAVSEDVISGLSPGDLDEVILVWSTVFDASDDPELGIVPFVLVGALRSGFYDGIDSCL